VGRVLRSGGNHHDVRREDETQHLEGLLPRSPATKDALLHRQPHHPVGAHLTAQYGVVLPADDGRRKGHHVRVHSARARRLPAGRCWTQSDGGCVNVKMQRVSNLSLL